MIPQNLRSFASLTKDIVVIGSGTHAEIWSAEAWDAYNDEEDFDSVIGVLADIDMDEKSEEKESCIKLDKLSEGSKSTIFSILQLPETDEKGKNNK